MALSLPLEISFRHSSRNQRPLRSDIVHAAMGELEARWLARFDYEVDIDRPYQHYQFAGRADVLAWTLDPPALLHLENRTRFPDLQEAAGSFNAKVRYLADDIARQLETRRFASQTHVMVGLWSAEVIHAVRVRHATFGASRADSDERLSMWLAGTPPPDGISRSFVLLDPLARGRQSSIVDLRTAIGRARPRTSGYREAAERLRSEGHG